MSRNRTTYALDLDREGWLPGGALDLAGSGRIGRRGVHDVGGRLYCRLATQQGAAKVEAKTDVDEVALAL